MADRIVFDYEKMEASAKKLEECAGRYEAAAQTFLTAMQNATASWQGASKNKFDNLVSNSVYNYMYKSVPDMVKGLASLLRNNGTTMQGVDEEIANKIPDSI